MSAVSQQRAFQITLPGPVENGWPLFCLGKDRRFLALCPRCETTVVVRSNLLPLRTTLRGLTTGDRAQTAEICPQANQV